MQVTKCDVQNAGCNRMYQKMCINFPEKGVCYVAIEAKVFKYDHVINFAKFLVKDKVASLVTSSSISISYEYDDTEVTPLGPIGEEEMNAMIPPGCDTVNRSENTSEIDDYEDPQKMFEYEFDSPAGKRTKIILHTRPNGDGGNPVKIKHNIMYINQEDPFGPILGTVTI